MNKRRKIIFCIVLVTFFLSIMNIPVFADDVVLDQTENFPISDTFVEAETTTEQAIQMAASTTTAQTSSGSLTETIGWTCADGVLTISGEGAMPDWEEYEEDWREITGSTFTTVIVEPGITHIGSYAFAYSELTDIVIADTVTSIGEGAFLFCRNLSEITIPGSVASIGISAFDSCIQLKKVIMENGVVHIGKEAFYNAGASISDFMQVLIPSSVTDIGEMAFSTNVIFYGTAGSCAEAYALENNIPFSTQLASEDGTVI